MIVSIVIPVYNGGESFQKCLSSLKQFIPPETEVVVVVDGGTDGVVDGATGRAVGEASAGRSVGAIGCGVGEITGCGVGRTGCGVGDTGRCVGDAGRRVGATGRRVGAAGR